MTRKAQKTITTATATGTATSIATGIATADDLVA